jgi:flagellar basal body rod protein FlgG
LYTSASGALVAQTMADNVANNLANVSTPGFKQTLLQIESTAAHRIYEYGRSVSDQQCCERRFDDDIKLYICVRSGNARRHR